MKENIDKRKILHFAVIFSIGIVLGLIISDYTYKKIYSDSYEWYYQSTRTYCVMADEPLSSQLRTCTHENGHDLWSWEINRSLKNEFKSIYNDYITSNNTLCIWDEEDVEQDFAYSYAYYNQVNKDMYNCTDKSDYFARIN